MKILSFLDVSYSAAFIATHQVLRFKMAEVLG